MLVGSKSKQKRKGKKQVNIETEGAAVTKEELFHRSYWLLNSAMDAALRIGQVSTN